VKKWKSVNIWWSYGQECGVLFYDSQCRKLSLAVVTFWLVLPKRLVFAPRYSHHFHGIFLETSNGKHTQTTPCSPVCLPAWAGIRGIIRYSDMKAVHLFTATYRRSRLRYGEMKNENSRFWGHPNIQGAPKKLHIFQYTTSLEPFKIK